MPRSCLRYCKSTIFQANHNANVSISRGWTVVCDTAKVRFFKQITTINHHLRCPRQLFAILQKYDFSSKSQLCFEYKAFICVVCDTAKVRFFKQITTSKHLHVNPKELFAILQKYDFSSKSQRILSWQYFLAGCLRYCKSTIFQANHNGNLDLPPILALFAILQKYDFSSKSQQPILDILITLGCLRYCKSTIFQANHNRQVDWCWSRPVVCDTAKVRFFKQITTDGNHVRAVKALFAILQKYDFSSKSQLILQLSRPKTLFAILQKYDFSSKSQHAKEPGILMCSCLRYCKSTIFQANHNNNKFGESLIEVVCDTAKVRFFKQITTSSRACLRSCVLFAILQKYDFSSKSQQFLWITLFVIGCLRYCKSTIFQANHNYLMLLDVTLFVVCDTAKVRFFKQITTIRR